MTAQVLCCRGSLSIWNGDKKSEPWLAMREIPLNTIVYSTGKTLGTAYLLIIFNIWYLQATNNLPYRIEINMVRLDLPTLGLDPSHNDPFVSILAFGLWHCVRWGLVIWTDRIRFNLQLSEFCLARCSSASSSIYMNTGRQDLIQFAHIRSPST